jgi:hypothetical protein
MNPMVRLAVSPIPKSAPILYEVHVTCNKCSALHDTGITMLLNDGPRVKQSLYAFYDGKTIPKNLTDLVNNSISCPKTGRQSTQKNTDQIFLVPPKI